MTGTAIGEVLNRVCNVVIWLRSANGIYRHSLPFSKGRDAGFVEIFQRFLSREPFEHYEGMNTECPQRKPNHEGGHVSPTKNHASQEHPTMTTASDKSQRRSVLAVKKPRQRNASLLLCDRKL